MDPADSDSSDGSSNRSSSQSPAMQVPSEGFVSSVFSLLGLGLLLPWNAFISAKPYFEARICSDAEMTGNIEVLISLVFTGSSVLSLFLMIFYKSVHDRFFPGQQAVPTISGEPTDLLSDCHDQRPIDDPLIVPDSGKSLSSSHTWYMVCLPLFIYFLVFVILAILVFFPSIPAPAFYVFLLGSLAICGVMVAVASAGVVATASRFPPKVAIAHFMTGQAVGGVAVSGAKFLAAIFEDPSVYWDQQCGRERNMMETDEAVSDGDTACLPYTKVDWASFAYFLLGSLVLGACIIGYNEIDKYQQLICCNDYEPVQDIQGDMEIDSPRFIPDFPSSRTAHVKTSSTADSTDDLNSATLTAPVWKLVKGPATSIFFAFVVTLAIFPAWTSTLKSIRQCKSQHALSRVFNDLYIPGTFVIFNVGDLTGRLLVERAPLTNGNEVSTKLVLFAVSRSTFFGFFLLCAASKSAFHAISSDLYSLIVQFALAVSNGALVSAAFMHTSKLIPNNAEMQERSSEMLTFALSLGLLCGSLLSFCYTNLASGM